MFELSYFVHLCLRYLHIDDSECFRIPRVPREQPWNKFWDNLCFWQQWSHHPLLTNTRDRRKNHQVPCTRYGCTNHQVSSALHQSLMHQSHQRRAVHGGLWRPVPGRNDRCDANVPLRNPNWGDDWALHWCLAGAFCIILPEAPTTINKVQEWRMNNVNWTFQQ